LNRVLGNPFIAQRTTNKERIMKRYATTNWKARIVFGAATIAVAVAVLESVAGGMRYPDQDMLAARRQMIAAQAEQVERLRALQDGQVKAADLRHGRQI